MVIDRQQVLQGRRQAKVLYHLFGGFARIHVFHNGLGRHAGIIPQAGAPDKYPGLVRTAGQRLQSIVMIESPGSKHLSLNHIIP
jgi:hypothetical protein